MLKPRIAAHKLVLFGLLLPAIGLAADRDTREITTYEDLRQTLMALPKHHRVYAKFDLSLCNPRYVGENELNFMNDAPIPNVVDTLDDHPEYLEVYLETEMFFAYKYEETRARVIPLGSGMQVKVTTYRGPNSHDVTPVAEVTCNTADGGASFIEHFRD
jgi:hypothetical protein